jgi:hypothetical protein
VKKQKLKKKELAVSIGRLVEQFSELNNRLNRVSHDKINQGIQLDQLSRDNLGLQQRFEAMQTQIEQVITQEEAQSRLLETLQLQTAEPIQADESAAAHRENREEISRLNRQLASLDEQQQGLQRALEGERQTVDQVANKADDLRRDIAEVLSHIRRLEESGSELLVSDSRHESQIRGLQNDIADLGRRLQQGPDDREAPEQVLTRLLQDSAQPLLEQIAELRGEITEKGGQQKALEQRLLELSNRIGETGARVETQKQDRLHFDEILESRLARLEGLVTDLQPVSDADEARLAGLYQRLDQVEAELGSLSAAKETSAQSHQTLLETSRELAARLDLLDGALAEQSARNGALHDLVEGLRGETANHSRGLEERLAATDLRLAQLTEQLKDQPDPLASAAVAIEEQGQRFENTLELLKQEIRGLQLKFQSLDMDEHEATERLNSLASDLDRQAGIREEMEHALRVARDELGRSIDEIAARLSGTERLLDEQGESARDQLRRLGELSETLTEQGKYGVDLKLLAATLQDDAGKLRKSNDLLAERLDRLERSQQQAEENQAGISRAQEALEQEQSEIREHNALWMDSLQDRVKSALERVSQQAALNEGLSQRLDDLEVSLQQQFHRIEERLRKLTETESDHRERLALQEQSNHTLSGLISELQSEHQVLLQQTGEQKTFLEAMTSEYGKRQEESERMASRVGQLDSKVESAGSTVTYHSFAIGGLLILLLLGAFLGYNYLSDRIGGVERNLSLDLMKFGENYVTKKEMKEPGAGTQYDALAMETLVKEQQKLRQQFAEFEEQFAASRESASDRQPIPESESDAQPQAATTSGGDPREPMVAMPENLKTEPEPRLERLRKQGGIPAGGPEHTAAESEPTSLPEKAIEDERRPPQAASPTSDPWQALRESGGYTLQLIGVSSRQAILAFAERHGLQGELAYVRTTREGKDWYILLRGMYGSYREAAKALQGLPEALKSQQPWIRKMPGSGAINLL